MKTWQNIIAEQGNKPTVEHVDFLRAGAEIFFKKHRNILANTNQKIINALTGTDISDFEFRIKSFKGFEEKDKKKLKKKATQIAKALGIKIKGDVKNRVEGGHEFPLEFMIKAGI